MPQAIRIATDIAKMLSAFLLLGICCELFHAVLLVMLLIATESPFIAYLCSVSLSWGLAGVAGLRIVDATLDNIHANAYAFRHCRN